MTWLNDPDASALLEQHLPQAAVADPVSLALGASVFVSRHRFDLHIETPLGRSPRLMVARYYWSLTPPVALDFVREMKWGFKEAVLKKAYFAERNIRYIIAANEFDEEAVLGLQTPALEAPTDAEDQTPAEPPRRPATAPRRKNPAKRR